HGRTGRAGGCAPFTVYSRTGHAPASRGKFRFSMIIGARSTVRFANPLIALVAAVLVIGAAGCAGTDTEEDRLVRDVTEAYQTAKRAMQSQNYRRAIPIYEALQARFPFSDLS